MAMDPSRGAQKSSHEIGSDGTAGQSIDRHDAQAAAVGSVGGHTHHRNAGARGALDPGPQDLGAAREDDDPIDIVADRGCKSLFFAFPERG